MSNKWVQFLPIATAFLEDDGTIRLEWEWSSSLDTDAIDRGDSDMTLAEAEQVGERINDWLNTQPVNVFIGPEGKSVPTPGPLTARFRPEAWVNDYAVEVDPEGDQEWRVSAVSTEMVRQALADDDDLDFLIVDPSAPKWVREWSGPFTIEIVGDTEGDGE